MKTIFVAIAILLVLAVPTFAQEATDVAPAPTVEVTPEPTPTPAPEPTPVEMPGFNLGEFALGLLSGVAVTGAAIFGFVGKLKNDKVILDALERLGNSVPADLVLKLNALGGNMRDAGDVLVKVTDGQPNVIVPDAQTLDDIRVNVGITG